MPCALAQIPSASSSSVVLELSNLVVGTIDVDAASLSSLDGFALPLLVIGTALSPSSDWQPAAPERWCGSLVSVSRKARAESTCCLSALGCAVRSGMVHLCVNAYMHKQAVVCTKMKFGEPAEILCVLLCPDYARHLLSTINTTKFINHFNFRDVFVESPNNIHSYLDQLATITLIKTRQGLLKTEVLIAFAMAYIPQYTKCVAIGHVGLDHVCFLVHSQALYSRGSTYSF